MSNTKYQGIITVLATPFSSSNVIDYSVLAKHIDFLLASGVTSILEGGSTSEYYVQTLDERKALMKFVAEHVGKRAQLIAGTNSVRPDETIALNKYAEELGYDAVMLAAPFYSLPNTQELVAHFKKVAAATKLPIILYNFPARTGVDMSPEFLEGVRDVANVTSIKESSGSFARMIEHVVNFPHLQRICGADDQAVDAFLWGAESWIAGASNFLPAEHVALYKACVVKKDYLLGHKIMAAMMPLFYLLEQGGKYIQYVKYGTELAGYPVGQTREPLQGLTAAEKENFRRLYEGVKAANLPALVG